MKFESIIQINDLIRKIDILSHEIRIQALNSYLVTSNGSKFILNISAVSSALVEFSQEVEKYSVILRKQIFTILTLVTSLYKIRKKYLIAMRTKQKSKNWKPLEPVLRSEEDALFSSMKKIQEELKFLNSSIQNVRKLCKKGHYIAICSKVEVAYLSENSNFFRQITEKVENSVLQIFHALESIQREIKSNVETSTFTL